MRTDANSDVPREPTFNRRLYWLAVLETNNKPKQRAEAMRRLMALGIVVLPEKAEEKTHE